LRQEKRVSGIDTAMLQPIVIPHSYLASLSVDNPVDNGPEMAPYEGFAVDKFRRRRKLTLVNPE
jgi:hypothetical protein